VAERVNRRLSVASPRKLTAAGNSALAGSRDCDVIGDTVKVNRSKSTGTDYSKTEPNSSLVNSVQASMVLESATVTLYWGATPLVITTCPDGYNFSIKSQSNTAAVGMGIPMGIRMGVDVAG